MRPYMQFFSDRPVGGYPPDGDPGRDWRQPEEGEEYPPPPPAEGAFSQPFAQGTNPDEYAAGHDYANDPNQQPYYDEQYGAYDPQQQGYPPPEGYGEQGYYDHGQQYAGDQPGGYGQEGYDQEGYGQEGYGYEDPYHQAPQGPEGELYGAETHQGYIEPPNLTEDYGDPPMAQSAHEFVIDSGSGAGDESGPMPPIPGADLDDPDARVTQRPRQESDPMVRQPDVAAMGLGRVKDAGPPPLDARDESGGFRAPSIKDLQRGEPMEPEPPPPPPFGAGDSQDMSALPPPVSPAGGPNYAQQTYGDLGDPAIGPDGVPRFVPEMPEEDSDPGEYGRRVAGFAWLFFALLSTAGWLLGGTPLALAMFFHAPIVLVGLLLLTGAGWSGIVAILFSVLYGLLFLGLGLLVVARAALATAPVVELPMWFGGPVALVGLMFIVATCLMTIKGPGPVRSWLGAALLILPLVGATAVFSTVEVRPRLSQPIVASAASRTYGSEAAGITVDKPRGWAEYQWLQVVAISPMGKGLSTTPVVHLINDEQNLLFTLYSVEAPRRTISDLLGQESLTAAEEELMRGLPKSGEAATFTYQGVEFREQAYEGTVTEGVSLGVLVVRGEHNGRMIVAAVTWDADPKQATRQDANDAMNEFFSRMELVTP